MGEPIALHGATSSGTAAWSAPIVAPDGTLLGSLAVHDRSSRQPTDAERRLIDRAAELAAIAIARQHAEEVAWRLASIVQSTGDAITSVNLDRVVTSWNRGAEKVYGYSAAEVLGRSIVRTIPPERAEEARAIVARALRGEVVDDIETERVRKDGTRVPIALTVSPIVGADGQIVGISSIARDITQRRRVEAALREREIAERLREGQKLAALGTLAGGVAHDFNNLLVPIITLTRMTARRLPERSRERADLDTALLAADRAKQLVRQILTLSRSEPQSLEPRDIGPIVADAVKLLRASLPTTIAIRAELSPSLPPVLSDSTQVQQVVMNLCTNAAQAIGERMGAVMLTLAPRHVARERPARAGVIAPGDYVVLEVADDGAGMDEATLARAFEPYFTTKDVGKGTGLGLAMVHGIVQGHGGHVEIASRPGHGTTVAVYLPARASAGAATVEPVRAA
jgi:PAS domain S-box-containing protein